MLKDVKNRSENVFAIFSVIQLESDWWKIGRHIHLKVQQFTISMNGIRSKKRNRGHKACGYPEESFK